MNDASIALLQRISENTEMGRNSLRQLLPLTQDPSLHEHLQEELREYESVSRDAHALLAGEGKTPKEQSPFAKASAKMGMVLQTLTDKSTRKLTEMILEGNQMGLTDIIEALEDYKEAEAEAIALAKNLQQSQSRYAEKLQAFL